MKYTGMVIDADVRYEANDIEDSWGAHLLRTGCETMYMLERLRVMKTWPGFKVDDRIACTVQ